MKKNTQRSILETVESPVSEKLILICEKCGKSSRDLQQALKKEIKGRGDSEKRRAVLTSCMNICPKERIAVAVVKVDQATHFFTVEEGFDDAQGLLNEIHFI